MICSGTRESIDGDMGKCCIFTTAAGPIVLCQVSALLPVCYIVTQHLRCFLVICITFYMAWCSNSTWAHVNHNFGMFGSKTKSTWSQRCPFYTCANKIIFSPVDVHWTCHAGASRFQRMGFICGIQTDYQTNTCIWEEVKSRESFLSESIWNSCEAPSSAKSFGVILLMATEVGGNNEERLCITQHEQREYDACNWENPDFPGDGGWWNCRSSSRTIFGAIRAIYLIFSVKAISSYTCYETFIWYYLWQSTCSLFSILWGKQCWCEKEISCNPI